MAITTMLLLAGCGGTGEEAATSEPDVQQAADNNDRAPGLVVNTIGGGQIDFADLLGQDAVLWFWAPW